MKRDTRKSKKGGLFLTSRRKKNRGIALVRWRESQRNNNSKPHEARDESFIDSPLDFSITPTPDLSTEEPFALSGRRIVEIGYFIQQLQQMSEHSPFGCSLSNMKIISERRMGLNSALKFKCMMCNIEKIVWTNTASKSSSLGINTAAVTGTLGIGAGFSNLEEFLNSLNIPCMSKNTYASEHEVVSNAWEQCATDEMKVAVEEEKEMAVQRGDVDAKRIPLLTVIVDGTWSKRSYKSNYASLSGAAAIVGYHTKKVLHLGVRNKYCSICTAFAKKKKSVPEHKCYKNWSGTSSAMESDIIVEGFRQSMPLHGVKFGRMIGDGDSNVYKKILDSRPYDDVTVEKIECKNHLLRNFCNKLKEIALNSKLGHIHLRKIVGSKILPLRTCITEASKYRRNNDPTKLREDIINAPYHEFGDHKKCDSYFCDGNGNDSKDKKNYIPELKESGILYKVMEVVNNLSLHSKSLLYNANNNAVEQFNSIIAKHIGGKRVNFSLRGSYETRCKLSVVSHNSKLKYNKIHKLLTQNSPGLFCKKRENRIRETKRNGTNSKKRMRKFKKNLFPDESYGPNCEKPDMPDEEIEVKKRAFLTELKKTPEEIKQLEVKTRMQAENPIWREERRKLLTSSNFGSVCNKLSYTSCQNIVKKILYSNINTTGMQYGRIHERDAKKEIETLENVKISECGLFVDEELNFLGATPDGFIETLDSIVEIKCPSSCENLYPNEAILQRKFTFWKTDRNKSTILEINKKHAYYFQIQGQLHITKKQYCLFALWTPKGIKIERIETDDEFWAREMESKLKDFYFDCLLPEILDPRFPRTMPIRDPKSILEAIENHKMRKRKE